MVKLGPSGSQYFTPSRTATLWDTSAGTVKEKPRASLLTVYQPSAGPATNSGHGSLEGGGDISAAGTGDGVAAGVGDASAVAVGCAAGAPQAVSSRQSARTEISVFFMAHLLGFVLWTPEDARMFPASDLSI